MTRSDSAVTRREFVRGVAAAGGALLGGSVLGACEGDRALHPHAPPPSLARGGGAVTRVPLATPPVVSPGGLALTAAPGVATILPGRSTAVWAYNGAVPGPTIQARSGDRATIAFTNGLGEPSITHWHGLLVDHANDGHPHQAVAAGGSYAYDFTVAQRAALDWYHPHPHLLTGGQVYRGLAGAFLVRDDVDTGLEGNALGLPAGAYEVPLIIRDVSFDASGALQFSNKSSGFWGNTPVVNGTAYPYLSADQAVYRFRVLNGCNARVLRLALASGAEFTVIGNDGGLLAQAAPVREITLSPGERADLLMDLRALAPQGTLMLRCLDAGWDILQLVGTGLAGPAPTLGALPPIAALANPATTRRFSFDGMTRINGKVYDMSAVEFRVPFDTVERWTFVTNGNAPHPVHVHGAHFQVVSRTGGRNRLFPWERGWKDTVLLHDRETVDVLIRFTAHRGLYVMHCHQLAHEDSGMMANFEVV